MNTSDLANQIDLIVLLSVVYMIVFAVVSRVQGLKVGFLWGIIGCVIAGVADVLIPVVGKVAAFVAILWVVKARTKCELSEGVFATATVWVVGLMIQLFALYDSNASSDEGEVWRVSRMVTNGLPQIQELGESSKTFSNPSDLVLSGISISVDKRLAIVRTAVGSYVVTEGELLSVRTKKSPVTVFCKSISESGVVLLVGPEKVEMELLLGVGV